MTKKRHLYFTNRKEYYRQKGFKSFGIPLIEKELEEEKFRIRRQVVINTKYAISLRAISINGQHTEKDLSDALDDFMNSNPALQTRAFSIRGFEVEEIDDNEDKGLKENVIYIEFNVRGLTNLVRL